ncbi:neo-calmodulin [Eurytemora carolleeae]|uniref:neo-calmodulin n=1 Tax=Eurytemora carolleeae TaxID=1294199 RepID=UPI000C7955DF|nr:neo-calmodulin [Eurytemora carolleeae]|eukprot:XP_023338566.1 neo-calmodulin-like [Eurytemora affinis]
MFLVKMKTDHVEKAEKTGKNGPKEKCALCKTPCEVCIRNKELADIMENLKDEDVQHYKEMFQMFDKDGDGTISVKELGTVLRTLGLNPSEEEVEEMIEESDKDGSGSIDFQEFCGLMVNRDKQKETPDDIKQIFRVFDKDGNGYVSSSELKFVMSRLNVHFSDSELQEMVLEADLDGDGQINFNEFFAMMMAD